MPRPRWTTRRIMAAVAALAGGLGLGLPAFAAMRDHPHRHVWEISPREASIATGEDREFFALELLRYRHLSSSFAGRYWRHLRGLPPPPCREPKRHPGETCSLEWYP